MKHGGQDQKEEWKDLLYLKLKLDDRKLYFFGWKPQSLAENKNRERQDQNQCMPFRFGAVIISQFRRETACLASCWRGAT